MYDLSLVHIEGIEGDEVVYPSVSPKKVVHLLQGEVIFELIEMHVCTFSRK